MEPPQQVVPSFDAYIGAREPQLGSRYPHVIHPSSSFNLLHANYIYSRDQHPQRVWPNPEPHPLSLGGSLEQENCLDGVHGEENGEERRATLDLLASVRSWLSNMPPSPPFPNVPHSVISEAGETEVPSSEGYSQAEELNSLVAASGRIDCSIAGSHAAGDHQQGQDSICHLRHTEGRSTARLPDAPSHFSFRSTSGEFRNVNAQSQIEPHEHIVGGGLDEGSLNRNSESISDYDTGGLSLTVLEKSRYSHHLKILLSELSGIRGTLKLQEVFDDFVPGRYQRLQYTWVRMAKLVTPIAVQRFGCEEGFGWLLKSMRTWVDYERYYEELFLNMYVAISTVLENAAGAFEADVTESPYLLEDPTSWLQTWLAPQLLEIHHEYIHSEYGVDATFDHWRPAFCAFRDLLGDVGWEHLYLAGEAHLLQPTWDPYPDGACGIPYMPVFMPVEQNATMAGEISEAQFDFDTLEEEATYPPWQR
jgi:hypothetical protein